MSTAIETVLNSIWDSIGWTPESVCDIRYTPTAVTGDLPVTDIATAAYAALASAAADLHKARGQTPLSPFVDRQLAGLAMTGNDYVRIDGEEPDKWGAITGYFRCKGGEYVYLHGQFPHLRDGLLDLFRSKLDRDAMAEALSGWTADDAEIQAQERGLCVIRLRSRAEWQAHPQAEALSKAPVVSQKSLGHAAQQLGPGGDKPLTGVRVLDMSRVIAGPMAGRALAELGADVLRISAPDLPSLEQLVIDTGFGKRAAFADLTTDEGRSHLNTLIAEADIFIDGFRPGALAAKGYGVEALSVINPSLSIITLSAFSDVGPWAGRRGYDSYVQAGVGLTAPAIKGDAPIRLSTQPLDYITGCLCACGGVVSLLKRMNGTAGLTEMSLARTAMWVHEMADKLGPDPVPAQLNATFKDLDAKGLVRKLDSDFGSVQALAPPYGFDDQLVGWSGPPHRLGSSDPNWL